MKLSIASVFFIIFLAACSPPKNSIKYPEKADQKVVVAKSDVVKFERNSKVDILFIVDNSTSMKDEQEKIRTNIEKFVNEFINNDVIDYHIAVSTVYDSTSFGSGLDPEGNTKKFPETPANGTLRKPQFSVLENEFSGDSSLPQTCMHDYRSFLSKSLLSQWNSSADGGRTCGVNHLDKKTRNKYLTALLRDMIFVGTKEHRKGGPLNEEIFSAIKESLRTNQGLLGSGLGGFYRKNAHLAIVIISDAEDETPWRSIALTAEERAGLSPEEIFEKSDDSPDLLAQYLKQLKQHDSTLNTSLYGIISPTRDEDRGEVYASNIGGSYGCSKDYNEVGKPELSKNPLRVESFLELMEAQVYSLCDEESFSEGLMEIGSDIRKQTLFSSIALSRHPDFASIQAIKQGDKVIPRSKTNGWYYDPINIMIHFSNDMEVDISGSNEFEIIFTPANVLNLNNGKTIKAIPREIQELD